MSRTAAALIIGNELLSGKTEERNLIELARLLRSLGVELQRVVFVLDDRQTISDEVSTLAKRHDVVFTSGGVGPTHDDITLDAMADAFGVDVVPHPDLVSLMKEHYGEELNEGQLRLASVPRGAKLLVAKSSRWPALVMDNVWILPGIPEVFRMKLPIVREHLGGGTPFVSRAVFTKMDEPDLKELLDRVVAEHPGVDVGSYPTWSSDKYRTKITFDGKDADAIESALQGLLKLLPEGEPQWME
jgi:molybdenum cofactor synthesis domain-containing protein